MGLPGKRLGLQFVLIYFVTTSHITSSTIPNCFSVNTQYCPWTWTILSVFERFITNTWGLGSLKNAENEANLLLPLDIQKLKSFQLPPLAPDQGLCPCTPLGAPPQTPVIGSRSALAICVHPTFLTWRRPCFGRSRLATGCFLQYSLCLASDSADA